MRCAIYRRVSTEMQREEGFSLEAQELRLRAYAASQDWSVVEDYCDDGYSAKNTDRPALKRMIEDMMKKKFDVILVYRLDRFVRSVLDLHELLQIMDKYDVKFKSSTEVFDTTTATGRLFITIIATLAQWERETIAERVFDSMLKRSEQGKRNGAPPPYGYDLVDGKLVKNLDEAKWVKFMFEKYQTNGSQNIAKSLNKRGVKTKKNDNWSDFAVRYVLSNPIYCGKIRWNYRSLAKGKLTGEEVISEVEQENFESIISVEVFEQTQKLREDRSQVGFRSDNHYPFSGVACCPKCGKKFTGAKKTRKAGGEYRYYKCQGRFLYGICDTPTLAEESFEKAFLEALELFVIGEEEFTIETVKDPSVDNPEVILKQLTNLQNKKARIRELYIDGDITKDDYNRRNQALQLEEMELQNILSVQEEQATTEEIKALLQNVISEWHSLSNESKKNAVHLLFKTITFEIIVPHKPGKYPEPAVLKVTNYKLK